MNSIFHLNDYKKEVNEVALDDLCGLSYEKNILKTLKPFEEMDYMLLIPNTRLFLFSGPDGYGKHTLANAFANELNQYGYEFFVIDGELLAEEENEKEILTEIFGEALQSTYPDFGDWEQLPQHRKCYLVLDHLDRLCESKKACGILSRMFALLDSDDPNYYFNYFTIVGIATDAGDIPDNIRIHMQVMELQLPEHQHRMAYFKNELTIELEDEENETSYKFIPVDAGVPEYYLADQTDGFSYGELRRAVMMIKMYYKQHVCMIHKDNFRKISKDIIEKKNFLKQEQVEEIISRMKKAKRMIAEKKNVQTTAAAPQVIYVGGDVSGISHNLGSRPNISYMEEAGSKVPEEFDEEVVNVARFSYLAKQEKTKKRQSNEPDLTMRRSEELETLI